MALGTEGEKVPFGAGAPRARLFPERNLWRKEGNKYYIQFFVPSGKKTAFIQAVPASLT